MTAPLRLESKDGIATITLAQPERMNALLASLSTDARAGLSPGFTDAGQAMMNLESCSPCGWAVENERIRVEIESAE